MKRTRYTREQASRLDVCPEFRLDRGFHPGRYPVGSFRGGQRAAVTEQKMAEEKKETKKITVQIQEGFFLLTRP